MINKMYITLHLCKPPLGSALLRTSNINNSLQSPAKSNIFHHHYWAAPSHTSVWDRLTAHNRPKPLLCKCQINLLASSHAQYQVYAPVYIGLKKNSVFPVTKHADVGSTGMTDADSFTTTRSEKDSGPTADTGWVIRLANENGYLSWCRNTYLATVIGVAMWAEGTTALAVYGAEGAFVIGGLNLVCGTFSYLNTILRLRRKLHMSYVGAGLLVIGALSHMLIWISIVLTYLGYVEAVEEELKLKGFREWLQNFIKKRFRQSSDA